MKRLFDVLIGSAMLILLIPVLIAVAVSVLIALGSPILFTQVRPGLNRKTFKMYKFRSMANLTDENGDPLPDDKRLGRFGKILRSTSLDELPELYNVLKGDMSLVGPRPLLVEYLPLYTPEQSRRHEVRPGITGWAQVNGRNAISWEERLQMDVWYVDNRSLILDLKILFLTAKSIIRREDISQKDHVTMPKFTGSRDKHE